LPQPSPLDVIGRSIPLLNICIPDVPEAELYFSIIRRDGRPAIYPEHSRRWEERNSSKTPARVGPSALRDMFR
jgi:hypothetical protein